MNILLIILFFLGLLFTYHAIKSIAETIIHGIDYSGWSVVVAISIWTTIYGINLYS